MSYHKDEECNREKASQRTLKQQLQIKLIEEIFPSFSWEHQQQILKIITEITKEWLTQKRQEYQNRQETYGNTKAIVNLVIGELLEELESEKEKEKQS